ncbi:phospholipid scramblase family protein C343.06c isoform X1 [Typha latifolia]|uniref:phospholipid scramblase family protein C343.06c isoform X1 n=1 Tax=Typha latifolia TaxID=4733 RepID=UPI003C2C8C7A
MWLRKWSYSPITVKISDGLSKLGLSIHQTADKCLDGPSNIGKLARNIYLDQLTQSRQFFSMPSQLLYSGCVNACSHVNTASSVKVSSAQSAKGNTHNSWLIPSVSSRQFGSSVGKEGSLSRDWLAQLWIDELRKRKVRRRIKRKVGQDIKGEDSLFSALSSFQLPFLKSAEQDISVKRPVEQPPISHYAGDLLSPSSQEEVKLVNLLSRANLVIARDIEWANIMFSFEQESRYVILDACFPQSAVGFIREKSSVIFRQLLRSRRPFVADVTDAMGNEIFRVRRPIWLINSTIYAEVDGKEVGVVHRRWHLWRRIYDLYLGNKQFAVVENPGFWNWTFTLKDEHENVLAQIDRNWRGIGLELFTDAGQYVIRFGEVGSSVRSGLASPVEELKVARPLTLSERAVALALAISLDTDYFSRRGGWGLPILIAGE